MPAQLTIGVLSDTHIPDRSPVLHPAILARFRQEGVSAILHAGDVCIPSVLEELRQLAPVYAVRGNRDIYYLRHLPSQLILEFNGVQIGLMHGHGGLANYMRDKLHFMTHGIDEQRIFHRAVTTFPQVQVHIFGHLHRPVITWLDGHLLFNPGSACCQDDTKQPSSAGILRIDVAGQVVPEIFLLGY